jgi:hypothetical protein
MAKRSSNPKYGFTSLWFPLALVVLLLLAIPGAVLLALNLLGKESSVNGWLQEKFGISYHIPIPWWAGLLLLLVPLLIVLLYFLKLKRKPLQVPSTFLWRKSIEDMHVNTLFQWLRDNVFLLIQLVTILFLIYSVMAFQVHASAGTGKHYILLIDNSASMAATDVAPNRLEVAKQEALAVISTHGEKDYGMVIVFNNQASTLQPYTSDRGLLRRAVERITQTQRTTRIDNALDLADSLANPRKSTLNQAVTPDDVEPGKERTYVDVMVDAVAAEVHLFSDGRFSDGGNFAAGNLELNYHRIGKPGPADNVGIVVLNASPDEKVPGKVNVFARVLNYRKEAVQTRVRLEVRVAGQDDFQIYDQKLDIKGLTIIPGDPEKKEADSMTPGEGKVAFDLKNLDDGVTVELHAKLLDVKDYFPLDDEAWLVLGVVRKARVLVVTEGNKILSDFLDLEATGKVATVQYLTPADLKDEAKYGQPAREGNFDLIVFDRCAPESELPFGNTFFIDAVPPPWKRSEMPSLKDAVIRNPVSDHPLMQHLTGLDDIAFTQAFRFDLKDPRVPPHPRRLLEADRETAVLFTMSRRAFTDLVMTFPLVNSQGEWTTNWNLKLSFPVFLRNVLYNLGNVSDARAEENKQPGDTKLLRPDVAVAKLDVTDPAGSKESLTRSGAGDFTYKSTERVGVYRATWVGNGERSFAVNLLDADESDIRPRDEIKIGSTRVVAGQTHVQSRETWKWSAVAALVLLVLEWAFYHRRIFY